MGTGYTEDTAANEKMEVDEFVFQGDALGLVKPGYKVKLFFHGRVPHGFPFCEKVLRF